MPFHHFPISCFKHAPYKHYKLPLDGMRNDVTRYEPRTLSLRPFNFFLQHLKTLIFTSAKLFHRVHNGIHNGGCLENWNLLHVSGCEMFTFSDVVHEKKNRKQTLHSAQCGTGKKVWTHQYFCHPEIVQFLIWKPISPPILRPRSQKFQQLLIFPSPLQKQ